MTSLVVRAVAIVTTYPWLLFASRVWMVEFDWWNTTSNNKNKRPEPLLPPAGGGLLFCIVSHNPEQLQQSRVFALLTSADLAGGDRYSRSTQREGKLTAECLGGNHTDRLLLFVKLALNKTHVWCVGYVSDCRGRREVTVKTKTLLHYWR